MYTFALRLRAAFLSLLLVSWAVQPGSAQLLRFASSHASSSNVVNLANAYDGSIATRATLVPLLGGARLRVRFASPVPQGSVAGLVIGKGGPVLDLLNLELLSGIIVNTYRNSTDTTPNQSFGLGTVLGLDLTLLNAGTPVNAQFPAGVEFSEIEVIAGGVLALVNIQVYEAYVVVAPLPVELAQFQGKATPAGVALTWKTTSEHQNDHFAVERTVGSAENFQAIGQVPGAGNSAQLRSYQFTDAAPGLLNYYRLRQVDHDGKETLSPVVAVKTEPLGPGLSAYPNPAISTLTVTGPAGTRFGVFNQLGRQLQSAEITFGQQRELDVRSLPSGAYFLRDAATGRSTKFVKVAE